jgi:predicted PurR-regulated permease PerM
MPGAIALSMRVSARPTQERTAPEEGQYPPDRVVRDERRRVVLEVPFGQALRFALALGAVVLAVMFVWRVQEVLFLLLLALLLATAIEPLVDRLRRGPFNRGLGVLVVYTCIVLAIALPAYLLLPDLLAQSVIFFQDLPAQIATLRGYLSMTPGPVQQAAAQAIDQGASAAASPAPAEANQLLEAGVAAAHSAFDAIMVFVLAFYWIVERDRLRHLALRSMPPRHARDVGQIWLEIEEKLGAWVRGELVLMFAVGACQGLPTGCWGCRIRLCWRCLPACSKSCPSSGRSCRPRRRC